MISNTTKRKCLERGMKVMEDNDKKKKLGAGIIVLSVLIIIGQLFSLITLPFNLANLDETNNFLISMGMGNYTVTRGEYIFSAIIAAIILIAVILILFKKGIGVYIFTGIQVVSIFYSIITKGLSVSILIGILISLILPGLLLYFIYSKKEIYFNK